MIESFKGRDVAIGQKVKVYYNLHKKTFSVMDAKSRKVLAHGENIAVKNPTFEVNENGRQKVLNEGKKNVHAFIVGEFQGVTELDSAVRSQYEQVKYNPFKTDKFTVKDSKQDANTKSYDFAITEGKQVICR